MVNLKRCLLILLLGLSVITAGCASSTDENVSAEPGTSVENESNPTAESSADRHEVQADLSGVVKSIAGNEVVLALVETPEIPEGAGPAADGADLGDGDRPVMEQPPANMDGEDRPQMPDNMDAEDRPQMQQEPPADRSGEQPGMDLQYTGEEETLTIPVGITIVSGGGRGSGEGMSISDIQEGDVLNIWYSDGEDALIEYISIMQHMNGAAQ